MSISYGSTSGHVAVGIDVSMSPSTVTKDTSSVTLTWKIYFRNDSSWYFSGDNVTVALSNAISESDSYKYTVGSSSTSTLVLTRSETVSTDYSGSVSKTLSVAVSGLSSGGAPHESRSFTIPARPPQSPHNPATASASYVSDSQINVSWTRSSDYSSAEWLWSNVLVQRQTLSGSWSTIATLSGSATSYVDKSVSANSSYAYRVQSRNTSGSSGYASTAAVSTTPAAPTNVSAKRSGSNIVVSWSDNSPANTSWTIFDNGASVASGVSASQTSWTHSNASTSTAHQYTLEAVAGSRTSAMSSPSNSVTLLSAPAAPSQLTPVATVALGSTIQFGWQHNSTDTTDQSAFDLKYSVDGGSTWVDSGEITSATQAFTPSDQSDFATAETVQWQVMTWGDYATGSPWSAVASFDLSSVPSTTIQSPADASTLTTPSTTIEWSYFQAEDSPQAMWALVVTDATTTDELVSDTGDDASTTYVTDAIFANGGSYTIQVQTRSAEGLWSDPVVANITVDYALPLLPDVTIVPQLDSGYVELLVDTTSDGVAPDAVDLLIERQLGVDGAWETLGSDLGTSVDFIDPTAPLVGTITYRVSTISALPSMNSLTQTITPTADELPTDSTSIISGGPSFSQLARFVVTTQADMTVGRQRALNQFDGRLSPVATSSAFVDRTVAVSAKMLPPVAGVDATPETLDVLFTMPDPFLYRDALGRRIFCSLSAGTLPSAFHGDVTFTVTEIDPGTAAQQLAIWNATA